VGASPATLKEDAVVGGTWAGEWAAKTKREGVAWGLEWENPSSEEGEGEGGRGAMRRGVGREAACPGGREGEHLGRLGPLGEASYQGEGSRGASGSRVGEAWKNKSECVG